MSFQQGVTGLNAAGRNLEVIGNNVANASTIGAKASRAEFADIYARASGGAGTSIGIGVSLATVAQQFSQGSISSTDNALDVAINGKGFFQMQDPNGQLQYSRNGQFKVSNEGYITNDQGLKLLGHPINGTAGVVPGKAQPLQLPTAGIEPVATSSITLEINLDSRKPITAGGTPAIDVNKDSTYNNSISLTTYDAKGQSVALTYFFQKSATDTWNIYAAANGEPVNPDGNGVPQALGSIVFEPDGSKPTVTLDPFTIPATGANSNGVGTMEIPNVTMDISKLTQFGQVFGPTDVKQNGFPPGRLSSVSVQSDGTLVASYSSGQSSALAKIELANFRNPQGLMPMGGNGWSATYESGEAVLGSPGGGNLGLLSSQSLEESNVDLTNELVNMMVAQRIYQANAQTIKTQDSVMQTLVNLR